MAAYRLESNRVVPGQSVPATLYWQVTGDPAARQDPQIKLELIDENGRFLDSQVTWPVPGLSPNVWPADKLIVSKIALYVPPNQSPNKIALTLTPILRVQGQVKELNRLVLAELITTGGVSQVDGSSIPNPRQEVFASGIKLRGYDAGAGTFTPGAVVPLDLYWEVLPMSLS